MRIGSWNACGPATDKRKRIEMAQQLSKRDLDIVGIQEPWEKERAEIGNKLEKYAQMGGKRKRQRPQERRSGRGQDSRSRKTFVTSSKRSQALYAMRAYG